MARKVRPIRLSPADAIEREMRHGLTQRIIETAKSNELTVTQIAKAAKTSRARVTQVLRGDNRGISVDVLLRILGAAGETVKMRFRATSDPTLKKIVRLLVELYRPERIYLFGSKARGDAGPDSDYDLMLVVPDSAPEELLKSDRAYKALWELGTGGDILVWTKTGFDSRLDVESSLPATIVSEGKLLYAA